MEEKGNVKVTISLPGIGFIVWIVFLIMGYGFKVDWLYNNPFWIWFPLWAPLALSIVVIIIFSIIFSIVDK